MDYSPRAEHMFSLFVFYNPLLCCAYLQAAFGTMDYIIDTVSATHPLAPLMALLKVNGKLVTVGLPDKPMELPFLPMVLSKISTEGTTRPETVNAFSM